MNREERIKDVINQMRIAGAEVEVKRRTKKNVTFVSVGGPDKGRIFTMCNEALMQEPKIKFTSL